MAQILTIPEKVKIIRLVSDNRSVQEVTHEFNVRYQIGCLLRAMFIINNLFIGTGNVTKVPAIGPDY